MTGGYMKKITKKDLLILLTMWLSPVAILLLVISIYLIQPKVEAKLVSSVISVLAQHDINAEVSFSGRDGILKGEVDSQEIADNAQKLSLAVFGARVIRNQLIVKAPQYNAFEINNELQQPVIEKISYTTEPQPEAYQITNQEFVVAINEEKSQYSSEVERIMATMQQQGVSAMQTPPVNTSSIIVPLDGKLVETIENPKAHKNKAPEIVAISIIEPKKKPEKQVKSQQTSKSTNSLLGILDDFNLSLGSLTSNSAIAQEKIGSQITPVSSQSIDKIDLSAIQFSSGSTTLPNNVHQLLDKVATSIKAQSYPTIELNAYADDSDIAYARGAAIREYLVSKGINQNSIHVSGHTMTDNIGKVATFKIRIY